MAYKSNIPQPTDFISQSQKDFIGNYGTISNVWGKLPQENENVGDHIPLENPEEDERGGHKKLTLPEQTGDAATLVNELNLYSKEDNTRSELFYRKQSSGDVNKITDRGGLSVGGLILRAFVCFDLNANIIEVDRVDENGAPIRVPMSFNIASVVINGGVSVCDWTITFNTALPTADYIWVYQSANRVNPTAPQFASLVTSAQPRNDGTYSNTITATTFRGVIRNVPATGGSLAPNPALFSGVRMIFQAYTVAS